MFYCSTAPPLVSTRVDARVGWLVGWLFPARLGICLPVGAWWVLVRPFPGWACGSYPASARVYVRLVGGLGMWRVWPSFRSCSASSAVMTRPMMGGHCRAYSPPTVTARSWAASWGADTGCVMCSLSGLVYPSVVSSASGPMAAAQRWVSSDRVAAMWLTCWSPRYGSPVAVVSPAPSLLSPAPSLSVSSPVSAGVAAPVFCCLFR